MTRDELLERAARLLDRCRVLGYLNGELSGWLADYAASRDERAALAERLARAEALLRRAREHVADLPLRTGQCDHPGCGHRYCADIKSTNTETEAIVAAADAFLAATAPPADDAGKMEGT